MSKRVTQEVTEWEMLIRYILQHLGVSQTNVEIASGIDCTSERAGSVWRESRLSRTQDRFLDVR